MPKTIMGTATIYKPKAGGRRYQGIVTKVGSKAFEEARRRLKRLTGWPKRPSDGDTMEFLARSMNIARTAYVKAVIAKKRK